jgi:hypothetical protein
VILVAVGISVGIVGGTADFQPLVLGFLAIALGGFAVFLAAVLFADRRSSKQLSPIGTAAGAIMLAAFLTLFILGPIGYVAGWLPQFSCNQPAGCQVDGQ